MPRKDQTGQTPRFTFRLPPALRRDLELLARADKRELGDYIRVRMEMHKEENEHRLPELRARYPEISEQIYLVAEDGAKHGPKRKGERKSRAGADGESVVAKELSRAERDRVPTPPAKKPTARHPGGAEPSE